MDLPYAEDVNYWKTGRSSPDEWIGKARSQIDKLGGRVTAEAFGTQDGFGAAYMIEFEFEGTKFKIQWPVLPTRSDDERSARRQAATFLFHDVKSRVLSASVLGARRAFFQYVLLEDGRTAGDLVAGELPNLPEMMSGQRLLPAV